MKKKHRKSIKELQFDLLAIILKCTNEIIELQKLERGELQKQLYAKGGIISKSQEVIIPENTRLDFKNLSDHYAAMRKDGPVKTTGPI